MWHRARRRGRKNKFRGVEHSDQIDAVCGVRTLEFKAFTVLFASARTCLHGM